MKNSRYPIFFAATFLLLTVLACAIPGQNTASTPAPTFDTARLNQMIAETVTAAIAQTEQAAPTATKAPTKTPVPTKTIEPTPFPSGSSLTPQDDGTILYVDGDGGYQLNIAPGWLPVRINEQEYFDAFSLEAAANPLVQDALMAIKQLDPASFRLFIFDLQDGHLQNGFLTNLNFIWDKNGIISLEDETGIKAIADALPASMPELAVQSSFIATNANSVPMGVIVSEISKTGSNSQETVLVQKQAYINLEAGALVITFTTDKNLQDATLPFFDTLIESIKLAE